MTQGRQTLVGGRRGAAPGLAVPPAAAFPLPLKVAKAPAIIAPESLAE